MKNKYHFSGYATKNDVLCSDGRVIKHNAFKDCDNLTVPLVWQHQHSNPDNILGHALLENRNDGVYAYCSFNTTPMAERAKTLIEHGDITSMSIFANRLKQEGSNVIHGKIVEVSLVLAGANPGALIDNIVIQHSDGDEEISYSEAIIYTGESLSHSDNPLPKKEDDVDENKEETSENKKSGKTVAEVLGSLTEEQLSAVAMLLEHIVDTDDDKEEEPEENPEEPQDKKVVVEHSDSKEDTLMRVNVFEGKKQDTNTKELVHADFAKTLEEAKSRRGSLKEAVMSNSELAHAEFDYKNVTYGIKDMNILFPDAKNIADIPAFIKRPTEWVDAVFNGARHIPFSRLKTTFADVTEDEARARGYLKGKRKKEEVFKVLKRVTTPTTIYKKQKLDRDDVIDITDFDIVSFIKAEMRMMLNEEIARAILLSDGRDAASEDKISEENVRPIWKEDDLYVVKCEVKSGAPTEAVMEKIVRARKDYRGSGTPTFFTTTDFLNDMLFSKDKMGRRLFNNVGEVAAALGCSKIVEVPLMETAVRKDEKDQNHDKKLLGIVVNMSDYTIGADRGGEINMFDDFDIDFNQYKYLIETRISGALTLPKSAIIIEADLADKATILTPEGSGEDISSPSRS